MVDILSNHFQENLQKCIYGVSSRNYLIYSKPQETYRLDLNTYIRDDNRLIYVPRAFHV